MPNPETERERIAGVYSRMSDEELRRLASSGDEFTSIAREVLTAEITRRDLSTSISPASDESPSEPGWAVAVSEDTIPELDRTVTLRRYLYLPEALLAKGTLESAGIRAYVIDENMIRLDWFISNALGGLRLQVHEEDAEEAEAILSQPIPDVLQGEGMEEYQQPRCPKCQSLDVSYRDLMRSLLTRDDVVAWTCANCGNTWEADSDGIPRNTTS